MSAAILREKPSFIFAYIYTLFLMYNIRNGEDGSKLGGVPANIILIDDRKNLQRLGTSGSCFACKQFWTTDCEIGLFMRLCLDILVQSRGRYGANVGRY